MCKTSNCRYRLYHSVDKQHTLLCAHEVPQCTDHDTIQVQISVANVTETRCNPKTALTVSDGLSHSACGKSAAE